MARGQRFMCCVRNPEQKKPINRKHINIFLTALVGQSSQGRTPTRPRDKRDKMAFLLWELNRERPVCPGDGSRFVPGRGPICPRDGSCLSRTPSCRKCLCLLVFSFPNVFVRAPGREESGSSARTKRVSTKGVSMIRAISVIFLRNYCIKCPKIREIRPIHGYPFC